MYPETRPILDFTDVASHNLNTIAIADTSFYPTNFQIINPTLEITPPGFPTITVPYTVNSVNIFNSNNLNITCVLNEADLTPLPDGIWTITQSISPPIDNYKHKSFLRTEYIQMQFGKAFMKTDIIECDMNIRKEQQKVLLQIWSYIMAAIAAANQCNNALAMKMYQTAQKMLHNFLQGGCNSMFSAGFQGTC